jgi:hypothetical protein
MLGRNTVTLAVGFNLKNDVFMLPEVHIAD